MATDRTTADKLAQVLAEHELAYDRIVAEYECDCGVTFDGPSEDAQEQHHAHVAAVVLAHLTAEGWAQGREERTMRMEAFDTPYGPGTGSVWYRRRVTDWEPVDA